jgi:hypothetical protein
LQGYADIDAGLCTLGGLPELTGPHRAEAKAAVRQTRRIAAKRFATLQQHKAALVDLRPLPGTGEAIHGVMSGTYSAWSLATAIVELLDVPVDELVISTLGFNRPNANALCELLDAGKVRSALLNVSDYFRSSDRTIFADIKRDLEARGQRVLITRSHAKLLLFSVSDGRRLVVETSANLRSSQNWEQYAVFHDAELLQFHRDWITALAESSA